MKLDWLWQARFADGKVICQPPDDKYSKHDDTKDWNPSSYRDFLEYFDNGNRELESFGVVNTKNQSVVVIRFDVDKSKPYIYSYNDIAREKDYIHHETQELHDIQPIYYRGMQNTVVNGKFGDPKVISYNIGYQGKNQFGKNVKYIHRIPVV